MFALHLYRCAPKNQNVSTVCTLRFYCCCWNCWTTTCCVVAVVVVVVVAVVVVANDCATKKETAGHSKNSATAKVNLLCTPPRTGALVVVVSHRTPLLTALFVNPVAVGSEFH